MNSTPFAIERRGRGSKGRPPKQLSKGAEEDLFAEVQRLRAENEYLKKLQALVLEDERHQRKRRAGSSGTKAKHSLEILLSIAQLPRAAFYYHLKRMGISAAAPSLWQCSRSLSSLIRRRAMSRESSSPLAIRLLAGLSRQSVLCYDQRLPEHRQPQRGRQCWRSLSV